MSETTTRSNIEVVREYNESVFNQHNPGLASKYLAPGVTWHGQTLGTIEGVDNVTGMLRGFIGALPDLHAATQDGNLLGLAPTGRRVRWDAVDIYRLAGGMIAEEWAADDATAILHQLGAYTPPWLT